MGRWIEATWVPSLAALGSRRARQTFSYRAFVPESLQDIDLLFTAATATDLAEAEAAIAVANHGSHLVAMETLARLLLRSESIASSRIEGLVCSQRRLAEAAFAPEHASETARQVLANIEAMRQAISLGTTSRPLDVADVQEMHRLLMCEDRMMAARAGQLRSEQNWIGGRSDSPQEAAFVPPPPEFVEPLMADLTAFLNRTDLPVLAQAAIAHAQFETIHPFADGNGRVGRCLIHTVLTRRSLTPQILVPVSLVLAAFGDHYIQGLVDFRDGGYDTWCGTFASAARIAVDSASRFEARLATMISRWRLESDSRPGTHLWHACEQTTISPVFTVASLAADLGSTTSAALVAIERLAAIGIVSQVSLGKRNRVYINRAVLRLLDDFERDLLTDVDGRIGRLNVSTAAKTFPPEPALPTVAHAILELFPVGVQRPPSVTSLARITGYRPDQVRETLRDLAADGLAEQPTKAGWSLTTKGHALRAMVRGGSPK